MFNNDLVDGSFGVTSRVFLSEMTPSGRPLGTVEIPPNELVTSFSSKSELALNLSPDGRTVSFMGYAAKPDQVDVSNSNTPGVIDPTNPVPGAFYRAAAQLSGDGRLRLTRDQRLQRQQRRAAITAEAGGGSSIYTAGNAGNGGNPQPDGVILGAGAQLITPGAAPGAPTPVGSFNIAELGDKADKIGKDDNFRGLTIFNNVLYFTKGSGSNGVNTVYFVDTTGHACPTGTGRPAAGGAAAWLAAQLQPGGPADDGAAAKQHVHPEGLQHHAGQDDDERVPVRPVVREPEHCVRGGRGRRHHHLLRRDLHRGRRADHGRAAEMGVRRRRSGSWPTRCGPG